MRKFAILTIVLIAFAGCGGGKSSSSATAAPAASQAAGSDNAAPGGSMSGESASGTTAEGSAAMPNCGAVKPVWVNTKSHAYHEAGDPYYGKTKHGKYLCPSQAKAQGYHKAGAGAAAEHS